MEFKTKEKYKQQLLSLKPSHTLLFIWPTLSFPCSFILFYDFRSILYSIGPTKEIFKIFALELFNNIEKQLQGMEGWTCLKEYGNMKRYFLPTILFVFSVFLIRISPQLGVSPWYLQFIVIYLHFILLILYFELFCCLWYLSAGLLCLYF